MTILTTLHPHLSAAIRRSFKVRHSRGTPAARGIALLALQWIPSFTISENISDPHGVKPATTADVPSDLHDLIAHYFICRPCSNPTLRVPGHRCMGRAECERNYVQCSKAELGQIALVCRRWARSIQPLIFQDVQLYTSQDARSLAVLLKHPTTRVGQYITRIEGKIDGKGHLRSPWIHCIGLQILPKLRGLQADSVSLELEVCGLSPTKHMLSSIHPYPRSTPNFSAGVREFKLSDTRFNSLEHLIRLIKGMPSLENVECERVTWDADSLQAGRVLYPTSYLARDNSLEEVEYKMTDCTNDVAASWLGILLGPTRGDVLDLVDADWLRAMTSICKSNRSRRFQDEIEFTRQESGGDITVFLSPRLGGRQRRKIKSIVFWLWKDTWTDHIEWVRVDKQLMMLNSLETVLIILYGNWVNRWPKDVIPIMTRLSRSPQVKFLIAHGKLMKRAFVEASLTDGGLQEIGNPIEGYKGWRRFLE
ncbi:hypothetical protein NM688_g3376 [Phlebia brevispora]|uniref:Uncharacterized protein n=1 Tax=Phlebia brevispora TaxID=194682 RepID=A0ACC1T614_9APHY|nr:hypothetical protein NM688_g3376 [Phlebia brevispora]